MQVGGSFLLFYAWSMVLAEIKWSLWLEETLLGADEVILELWPGQELLLDFLP
jgi:hypothetical protein